MKHSLLTLTCTLCLMVTPNISANIMAVSVPVASIWTEPIKDVPETPPPYFFKDLPHHDSQLAYGELVNVIKELANGWYEVEALGQPIFDVKANKLTPLHGYMEATKLDSVKFERDVTYELVIIHLPWAIVYDRPSTQSNKITTIPFGALLRTDPTFAWQKSTDDELWLNVTLVDGREGFVETKFIKPQWSIALKPIDFKNKEIIAAIRSELTSYAELFLNNPYCWGGCCPHTTNTKVAPISSVDCSGLVHLLYKVALSGSYNIPRNANDFYYVSEPIKPTDMQIGDLLFFKSEKSNFQRAYHILMYMGDEFFIEATGSQVAKEANKVRVISTQELLEKSINELKNGMLFTRADGSKYAIECRSLLAQLAEQQK